MTPERHFPWDQLMHLGIGILRLPPAEFWRSTVRELHAAAGASHHTPMLRQSLEHLMQSFPDESGSKT